ncbi:hypothetical protein KVP09_05715 [Alcaligenaceae bacterium CGII-47]|nr:hypothetical protein [Alcaligenaceae bacterium CGII-47]
MLTDIYLKHLRRCIELVRKALATGNPPFGALGLNGLEHEKAVELLLGEVPRLKHRKLCQILVQAFLLHCG